MFEWEAQKCYLFSMAAVSQYFLVFFVHPQCICLSTRLFSFNLLALALIAEKVGARGFDVRQDSSALSRSLT